MQRACILSTGSFLPEKIISNEDLSQFSHEARNLIVEKTGVQARRHADETECTSDLAIAAARKCLQKVGFPPENLQGIVLSTSSPDRLQPATATRVQHELGARAAFAFDINSVCSGSSFGIAVVDALIRSETCRNILLVASEMYSKILNRKDFATYPFFGDGSGAVLFQAERGGSRGVLHSCLATDGSRSDIICVPGGGTMLPFEKMPGPRSAYFRMRGEEVFAFSLDRGPVIIRRLLEEAGVTMEEVKCFICHQANINILHGIAGLLGIPREKFFVNLDRYGNTASASVLIGLDEAIHEGRLMPGDLAVIAAFGGGLSWGANLIRI
ncbi:MAG TPA: ketoacyl-ACP synthase III [Syntrophales bacterium]|jgi:3-oxoacyl-[acyl-carrier-protein] synthase-3|nr:ketoacyl-ACP synthase III [Syntrophales bacterium]HRT61562.1 ketoacyl-ACP synthase III [Syntrophales bacterium]